MAKTEYLQFADRLRRIADLESSIAVLSWDKEVNMPPQGATFRSQQLATLAGLQYELLMDPELGKLIEVLFDNGTDLDEKEKRNVALARRDRVRQARLDQDFVVKRSRLTSAAYHGWLEARQKNDFAAFSDALSQLVALKREEAEMVGYEDHPYNALLEEFEPGCSVQQLDPLFSGIREELSGLVQKITQARQVNDDFLRKFYPKDKQWEWGQELLRILGFDEARGRQDISPHPFTITFSSQDVRVTTRVDENDIANLTWSCIHEIGHALYEQGLPRESYGLPMSRSVSLGIHESQSRLWENHVGRSRQFWQKFLPRLQEHFPGPLQGVDLDTFYRGINKVMPSFIRTESDELHYHLHVLIRYELEKALIKGDLAVAELPEAWNEKYQLYLGLAVPDPNQGVLQDIHWSHGSIGYFPTYTLGSFYAAQFFEQAEKDLPGLYDAIAEGQLTGLHHWLQQKIHSFGRFYSAEDLCKRITGLPLSPAPFMRYAHQKYTEVYQLG